MLHGNIHRHLLILSLVNWGVAVVCWAISAYLGVSQPANLFTYTVLFVIGLFAVVVAIGCYVLADFGTEPAAASHKPADIAETADSPETVASPASAD